MKIAMMIALCIGFIDAGCQNMNYRCRRHYVRGPAFYKEHCKKNYVASTCPALCRGECDEIQPTTTEATTTMKPIDECKDLSTYCSNPYLVSNCDKKYAQTYCRKTCGLCDGEITTTMKPTTTMEPTTTTMEPTTTTMEPTTTVDCSDKRAACPRYARYCATSEFVKRSCQKTCNLCSGVTTTKSPITRTSTQEPTTMEPTTTTMEPTTTTKRPITTTEEPITTTEEPVTTTKRTTRPTNTPVIPSGGCGDKHPMCFMKSMFNAGRDCGKYGNVCLRSCNKCSGSTNEVCANLKNRALDCSSRNCRASDPLTRHRAHTKCARTCCQKGELY